ncbi:hypothetical protein [Chryseobacterium indoltheticum]|uniref:hypothetical protein n=1 Tax=Chryseobacterium indoltheticum TaxID=254 RepID=UPI003F49A866
MLSDNAIVVVGWLDVTGAAASVPATVGVTVAAVESAEGALVGIYTNYFSILYLFIFFFFTRNQSESDYRQSNN